MDCLGLRVTVPICSLRKGFAREYLETERVPPPSTVYGFLLSLVGEERREEYIATQLAISLISKPAVSRLLRTVWKVKNRGEIPGYDGKYYGPGHIPMDFGVKDNRGGNRNPDYQEVLTGLEFGVWVKAGKLAEKIKKVLTDPGNPEHYRYGGLSLGESRDLVDEVVLSPDWGEGMGQWLVNDQRGDLPLPVWVDHIGSKGTNWQQFRLLEHPLAAEIPENGWITIEPPP